MKIRPRETIARETASSCLRYVRVRYFLNSDVRNEVPHVRVGAAVDDVYSPMIIVYCEVSHRTSWCH